MQLSGKKLDVRMGGQRVLFPCQFDKIRQLSFIHFPRWRATLSEECALGANSHSVSALEGNCSGNPTSKICNKNHHRLEDQNFCPTLLSSCVILNSPTQDN